MFAGPNAWNGPAAFATRVGVLKSLTLITDDTVVDTLAAEDYIISNALDTRLNTADDTLLTV